MKGKGQEFALIADAYTAPCSNFLVIASCIFSKYYCRVVAHTYTQTENTAFNHCVGVFQSAAAAPSPVMGNMPPNDTMPGGPMPPGFFQVCLTLSVNVLFPPPALHCLHLIFTTHPSLTLQKQVIQIFLAIFFFEFHHQHWEILSFMSKILFRYGLKFSHVVNQVLKKTTVFQNLLIYRYHLFFNQNTKITNIPKKSFVKNSKQDIYSYYWSARLVESEALLFCVFQIS